MANGQEQVVHTKAQEKKITKAELAKRLEGMRERDNELVTGVFRYLEHRGGTLRFRFKRYAQDEYKAYELVDGQKYRLPRMVARHLNQNVHYLAYKTLDKELGKMAVNAAYNDGSLNSPERMQVTEKVPRCEFMSLEFMDDDISPSNIVQVTTQL